MDGPGLLLPGVWGVVGWHGGVGDSQWKAQTGSPRGGYQSLLSPVGTSGETPGPAGAGSKGHRKPRGLTPAQHTSGGLESMSAFAHGSHGQST